MRVDLKRLSELPYRSLREGRDYWVLDGALRRPMEVVARLNAREDWVLGFPHRAEHWPGMRVTGALDREELAPLERWVRQQTGARSLWQESTPQGTTLDHNVVQRVSAEESGPRPHSDSRLLCRFAAVIYLSPDPAPRSGTSFYRLRLPDGRLAGNQVEAPYHNLPDALGVKGLPLQAWQEELAIDNVFNRMVLYRANLVHSATGYFGAQPEQRRTTALFFWMSR